MYYTFVYPHLLNGIELYGNTKASYLDKLIKLNNKLLRILQSKPLSSPTRELYKTYNTLQLIDLHKQQLLLFVHKYVHHPEKLPEIFVADKFFIFSEEIHDYSTRTKSNMHIYYSNNSAGLRTIRHKARGGSTLGPGGGKAPPPNVGQAPQIFLVPTAKIRIVKI